MPSGPFKSEPFKYGLIGALLGAGAPAAYLLFHFFLFHGAVPFTSFLEEAVLGSPEAVAAYGFLGCAAVVMAVAGVLVGRMREKDAAYKAEIELKNLELQRSQAELRDLTENLGKKVREGQEELIESARRLKDANAKLLRQVEIQRKIAGNVPSLLALVDREMRYVEMNEYGSRHFMGRPLSEILGKTCYEVEGKDGVCIEECATRKAFGTGREATHMKGMVMNGRHVIAENKSIPIKDADGNVTHVLKIVTDATARKKEEDDLKRRANHDALTGVYNKHYLDLYLRNEEGKNRTDKRRRGPYTIIYADLDNLKAANDTFGHEAGDILLRKMAQVFNDNTRHEDIIARIGGDEFVIILPHSGPEEGEVLINRFRRQCEEWNRTKDIPGLEGLYLSTSYGLAASLYGVDLADTIRKADSTMYRAKKDRRSN